MKKRMPDKFWFPWWPDKWIFGSMRVECTVEERAIWMDLLCLASKDDGYIRANEETPYPLEQLAGMLRVPEDMFIKAIEKFIKLKDKDGKGKLTRTEYGTLYVTKWEEYQFSERHKRRIEGAMAEKTAIKAEKEAPILHYNTLNKNTLNNKKEEQQINISREEEILIDEELKTVKGIGEKKREMVICYLRELSMEFPEIDFVHEMKKKCTWWRDNPLTKRSNIHLQIRNWFSIAQKRIDEAKGQDRVGAPRSIYKTKYPMAFLNSVYSLLRKQGKDGDNYSDLIFALSDEEAKEATEKYSDSPAEFIKFLEEKK